MCYRLPNGTHILIHSTETESDEGPDVDLKPPFTIPQQSTNKLIVNENKLSSEVVENGSNIDWSSNSSFDIDSISEEALTLPSGLPLVSNDQEELDQFGEIVISYKCRSCSFLSVERSELLRHFESCHKQPPAIASEDANEIQITAVSDSEGPDGCDADEPTMVYLCGECNEVLRSLEDCREHMMECHNLILAASDDDEDDAAVTISVVKPDATEPESDDQVTVIEASKCPEKWLNTKMIAMTDHRFVCSVRNCHLKFSTVEILDLHSRCHVPATRSFRCAECATSHPGWRQCAAHLWKAHAIDAGLSTCPVCHSFKTVTPLKLKNHLKTHGDARPYVCVHGGCTKSFKQQSQLRNHKVSHLDRKTVQVPRWYSAQKCNTCHKTYADSKCLKKHVQAVHCKLRPYKCNVCGHASARKAMLQMHHRQHTGEKPYGCDQCSYKTGDHNSLRRHKMRHSGCKPYKCPHCPYAAIQSNSYKNHLRNKHPGLAGSYNCVDCDFRTVSEESFLTHAKDHADGVIPAAETELFAENEIAANMIYQCLNADGNKWKANVTASATSADGMSQTITIQLAGTEFLKEEDDAQCFLASHLDEEEEGVDTGGITIPAEPEQAC